MSPDPCAQLESDTQHRKRLPQDRLENQRLRSKGHNAFKVELNNRLARLEALVEDLSNRSKPRSGKDWRVLRQISADKDKQGTSPFAANTASTEAALASRPRIDTMMQQTTLQGQLYARQKWKDLPPSGEGGTCANHNGSRTLFIDDIEDFLDKDNEGDLLLEPPSGVVSMLGYRSSDIDLRQFRPLLWQRNIMWRVYQENIEPLTKFLHVPTMERLFQSMSTSFVNLDTGEDALFFSIYYAAITTMEDKEVRAHFDTEKSEVLSRYRFALEQALSKAKFIQQLDITTLHAFAIFLTALRQHEEARMCWALTGLAIRIAHGLELDRDGTQLGLAPFEVEMRRRIWWSLCALDLQFVEELGTDPIIPYGSFSTEFPMNINDVDIQPDMETMPSPREGRTDCIVARVRYEICSLLQRMHTMNPKDTELTPRGWEQLLAEVYDRLDNQFLKYCITDEDPLVRTMGMSARVIFMKTSLIIYQSAIDTNHGLSHDIRDRLFVSAVQLIEYHNSAISAPSFKHWRWLLQIHIQWHAIAFVLLESLRQPWNGASERGWRAVNRMFALNSRGAVIGKAVDHTGVWKLLNELFLKARKHRELQIHRQGWSSDDVGQIGMREHAGITIHDRHDLSEIHDESAFSKHQTLGNRDIFQETTLGSAISTDTRRDSTFPSQLPPDHESEFIDMMMANFMNPDVIWSYINFAETTQANRDSHAS